MPGKENYCDKHVSRGCSCNAELKEGIDRNSEEAKLPENYVEQLDEKGRKLPCCEYSIIDDWSHLDKELIEDGWDAYYDLHPEKRRESEEVEYWENKLGVDND